MGERRLQLGGRLGARGPARGPTAPPVGLQIAEAGAGGRPLMLVHGFTGAKEDFTDFLEPLASRGWHAVAPDLRGHGASDHPAGRESYDFDILATDLVVLADALGWASFTLLGHSMGGALAQRVALACPSRLDGLVLMSTFHGPVRGIEPALVELGASIVAQAGMAGLARALVAYRKGNLTAGTGGTPDRLLEGSDDPVRVEARLVATSPHLWLALAPRFLDDPDRLDQLAAVHVPTAVIVGELDHSMVDDCRRLAATIPGARLTVIPGAGHSPQADSTGAWWDALVAFLDQLPARSSLTATGRR